ncbi:MULTISPECIES: heme exporter protein CcmB [Emticicia]|uniref:heme exporter protein CcmB n=1 Tax=Emticicia TaxID=312278 RepID=UPI00209FEA5C|nr:MULTISPECIES: heme exporter protein CcmB [Emticicia]UTA69162.1 heme exporter protein CcmB [Emticicia sp. 21SJ11W-3]
MQEIKALIEKEIRLEWRQKYALNGMLLYIISTIFVCYMSFKLKVDEIEPITWNTLLWIILLFSAVNSITKSFTQEGAGRQLYYYTLASPQSIILSKIIYNTMLMLVLSLLGFLIYLVMMGNPVMNLPMYLVCLVLGAIGFATTLTMVAGIASKAENTSTLMAILSFPIILPMLMMVIKLSKSAMDGLGWETSYDEIAILLAIDAIVLSISYLLFPYLWRS